MGKSYRKNKHFGWTTSRSEKQDRIFHHKKIRRRVHQQIQKGEFDDLFPIDEEVSDVWTWQKDGKQYYPNATKKDMGK